MRVRGRATGGSRGRLVLVPVLVLVLVAAALAGEFFFVLEAELGVALADEPADGLGVVAEGQVGARPAKLEHVPQHAQGVHALVVARHQLVEHRVPRPCRLHLLQRRPVRLQRPLSVVAPSHLVRVRIRAGRVERTGVPLVAVLLRDRDNLLAGSFQSLRKRKGRRWVACLLDMSQASQGPLFSRGWMDLVDSRMMGKNYRRDKQGIEGRDAYTQCAQNHVPHGRLTSEY